MIDSVCPPPPPPKTSRVRDPHLIPALSWLDQPRTWDNDEMYRHFKESLAICNCQPTPPAGMDEVMVHWGDAEAR